MRVLPHVVGCVLVEVRHHPEVVGGLPGVGHAVTEPREAGVGGVMGVCGDLSLLYGGGGAGRGGLPGGGGRLARQEAGVGHGGAGAHVGQDRLGGRGVERGREEGLRLWVGGDVRSGGIGRAGGGRGPGES